MDYSDLDFPKLNDVVVKEVAYSHNIFFKDKLNNKKLKIDDNLLILDNKTEVGAVQFLSDFVLESKSDRYIRGSFFLFTHDGKTKKRFYGAMDRVRMFVTAIRIFTEKRADANFEFSIKDSKKREYYRPFDLRSEKYDRHEFTNFSVISSKKDFNVIKKLHKRLGESNFEQVIYYSKLYNAVKFFNHAYNEDWTLLKNTLLFTSLESLFSDSSKTEVTEKIAIRTAYLLHPKDSAKRKEVYVFIKRGYEIRSLFVHGSNTETGINKIMKKFEKERGVDHYDFHHDFIDELHVLVCQCLKKSLLDETCFNFFSTEKHKDNAEQQFYTNLVL
jgi:hypothetical protein